LRNGVQLPENPKLYKRRNPDHSWGSSLTVDNLQTAITNFRRDSGFDREIVICDMSRKRGGRLRPHHSHRSGRDVDIRLPLRKGLPAGTLPNGISQVDWKATWALIRALLLTKTIKYIFLERNRQRVLRDVAEAAGASAKALEKIFQYPGRDRRSIIRHSRGHINHIHIRFICGENESDCSD
jgi:murein endopeptidase